MLSVWYSSVLLNLTRVSNGIKVTIMLSVPPPSQSNFPGQLLLGQVQNIFSSSPVPFLVKSSEHLLHSFSFPLNLVITSLLIHISPKIESCTFGTSSLQLKSKEHYENLSFRNESNNTRRPLDTRNTIKLGSFIPSPDTLHRVLQVKNY